MRPTADGDIPFYQCRIVRDDYAELINLELDTEERDAFIKIMIDNVGSLLYRTHPTLKELVNWKLDIAKVDSIPDGLKNH